jgi:hypothetical protein
MADLPDFVATLAEKQIAERHASWAKRLPQETGSC